MTEELFKPPHHVQSRLRSSMPSASFARKVPTHHHLPSHMSSVPHAASRIILVEPYSRPADSPNIPDTWATGNLQSCNRMANGNRLAPQTHAALAPRSQTFGEPGTSLVRPLHLHCCASNEAQSQDPNLGGPLVNGRSPWEAPGLNIPSPCCTRCASRY